MFVDGVAVVVGVGVLLPSTCCQTPLLEALRFASEVHWTWEVGVNYEVKRFWVLEDLLLDLPSEVVAVLASEGLGVVQRVHGRPSWVETWVAGAGRASDWGRWRVDRLVAAVASWKVEDLPWSGVADAAWEAALASWEVVLAWVAVLAWEGQIEVDTLY